MSLNAQNQSDKFVPFMKGFQKTHIATPASSEICDPLPTRLQTSNHGECTEYDISALREKEHSFTLQAASGIAAPLSWTEIQNALAENRVLMSYRDTTSLREYSRLIDPSGKIVLEPGSELLAISVNNYPDQSADSPQHAINIILYSTEWHTAAINDRIQWDEYISWERQVMKEWWMRNMEMGDLKNAIGYGFTIALGAKEHLWAELAITKQLYIPRYEDGKIILEDMISSQAVANLKRDHESKIAKSFSHIQQPLAAGPANTYYQTKEGRDESTHGTANIHLGHYGYGSPKGVAINQSVDPNIFRNQGNIAAQENIAIMCVNLSYRDSKWLPQEEQEFFVVELYPDKVTQPIIEIRKNDKIYTGRRANSIEQCAMYFSR